MKTSQTGIDLIKRFEGFSPVPYKCPAGKMTIGYGHVIRQDERFAIISEADADALLNADLIKFEAAVNALVNVPLTQGRFDALVSFVYNLGVAAFKSSTMLKRLNEKNYAAAADNFQRWVNVNGKPMKGLIRRRAAEFALFIGGGNATAIA